MQTVKCPTCAAAVHWSPASAYRPFCSDRCRRLDLGAWFDGRRALPDDSPADPESDAPPADSPDAE